MRIRAGEYYQTARERLRDARLLFDKPRGSYSLAMYAAGLAVECLCRAFAVQASEPFQSDHKLGKLFKESRILVQIEERLRNVGADESAIDERSRELRSAINLVDSVWLNSLRFASDSRVRSELNARRLYLGIKGDVLRENCRRLLKAAYLLIDAGVVLWNSRPK